MGLGLVSKLQTHIRVPVLSVETNRNNMTDHRRSNHINVTIYAINQKI